MNRSYQLGALLTGICAIVVAMFLPVFGHVAVKGPETMNLSNGKQLATACRLYAVDHGGRFPVALSEVQPEYVTTANFQGMRYRIIKDRKATDIYVDWLYFGAGFDDSNAPQILIASPQVIDVDSKAHRIFMQGDTASRVGPESAYQTLLTETVKQRQALEKARDGGTPPPAPAIVP